jgi:peptidoglycan/LPS O-acetylase OafA/YrhL
LSDWIAALTVATTILMFDAAKFGAPPTGAAKVVRYGADHTFSLYLYHYPLFVFANAVLPLGNDPLRQLLCAAGVLTLVLLLSTITEARRDAWRRLFEWGFDCVSRRFGGGKCLLPNVEQVP